MFQTPLIREVNLGIIPVQVLVYTFRTVKTIMIVYIGILNLAAQLRESWCSRVPAGTIDQIGVDTRVIDSFVTIATECDNALRILDDYTSRSVSIREVMKI